MALVINEPGEIEGAFWISPARLCLTADGRVTHQDDVEAVKLLVGKGGRLPIEEARKLGLVEEVKEKKAAKPAGNKARTGPENKGS